METILVTPSRYAPENLLPVEQAGYRVRCNESGRKLSEEEVGELIATHRPVGIIAGLEPLTSTVLGRADRLAVISRLGVGLDNVDLAAAGRNNILVTSTPCAPVSAVAELTITLILALLRRIIPADQSVRQGRWERPMGNLLGAQTLGLLGCGRIGSAVATLATAFGARVIAHDPGITAHAGLELVSLERLLSTADIISLHLPYTRSLHHYLDRQKMEQMKKGAFLVNTSRGGLIDENALCALIKQEHLAGAALDVFKEEPYRGPLVNLPQVVLTSHLGSYALESRALMEREAVANLLKVLEAKEGDTR